MAGARYWRIYGLTPYGGGDLSLTELGLYEAGVRVDAGAMLTATYAPTSGDIAALSDGSSSVACSWSELRYGMPSFALVYDLGVDRDVKEVRIGMDASRQKSCRGFSIQTSSDGFTWGGAFTTNVETWPGGNGTGLCQVDPVVYDRTVFLVRGRGSSVRDSGPLAIPFAEGIPGVISTAQAIYGPSSVYLNGAAASLIQPLPVFNLSSVDFTLDGWFYRTSNTGASLYGGILSKRWGGVDWDWGMEFNSTQLNFRFGDSSDGNRTLWCGDPALNAWHHYRVCRQGATLYTFLNGVLGATAPISGSIRDRSGAGVYVSYGRTINNYVDNWFQGYLYDVRLIRGLALSTSSFSIPPDTPLPATTDAAPMGRTDAPPQLVSPYPPPAFGTNYRPMLKSRHRMDFQGEGRIHGTVKKKGEPANSPLRRKVLCMDMLTSTVMDETWSDAATGEYTFLYLDRSRKYTVLSYDHSLAYRAAIADSLTPEKM